MNPVAWKKQEWFFLSILFLYKIRIYSCCSYLMPTIKLDLTKANAFKVISVIWFISNKQERGKIFTRHGVDGAVLYTPLWLMHSIIDYVNRSYFPSRSSNHFPAQTVKAREVKVWENIYPPQHVTCHMSNVTRHMLFVTCHISCVTFPIFWWS